MAFDSVPGGDPRGPSCPKCGKTIAPDSPSTIMHFDQDPGGRTGLSGKRWHAECARPYWDTITPLLRRLQGGWGAA
jgi:hypothetical protein